jgi:hypothetical protein
MNESALNRIKKDICPGCGSKDFLREKFHLSHEVFICLNCGYYKDEFTAFYLQLSYINQIRSIVGLEPAPELRKNDKNIKIKEDPNYVI